MKKIIVDLHCDTIQRILDEKGDLKNKEYAFNIQEAYKTKPYFQFMACFINSKYLKSNIAFDRANKLIDTYEKQVLNNNDKIIKILSKNDIFEVINNKKVGTFLTIENACAIEDKLENVNYFYNKGVRCMSLVWNDDNQLSCGCLTKNDTGLTSFGKKAIKEMERLNILIDVSHISTKGFWDILKITDKSIIATHSCVKKLCNHPRNLSDSQIKEIAKQGGVVGVCFYSDFLNESQKATSKDIAIHIDYIVNLVGIEHVALGSDFDGIEKEKYPKDVKSVKDIKNIFKELKRMGYKTLDIAKIAGENSLRIMDNIFCV